MIFPNAIDLNKYFYRAEISLRKKLELGLKENDVVIGHVGRYVDAKNHEFLIRVFSRLHKTMNHVYLLLIGSGPLKSKINNQVKELELNNNVIMLEHRQDVNELLQTMDLVVFPSKFEGFSMAMVEMQASGLRILCSDSVPHEIDVTGSVTFKSLNDGIESWAEVSMSLLRQGRNFSNIDNLAEYGLDIKNSIRNIQKIYEGQPVRI